MHHNYLKVNTRHNRYHQTIENFKELKILYIMYLVVLLFFNIISLIMIAKQAQTIKNLNNNIYKTFNDLIIFNSILIIITLITIIFIAIYVNEIKIVDKQFDIIIYSLLPALYFINYCIIFSLHPYISKTLLNLNVIPAILTIIPFIIVLFSTCFFLGSQTSGMYIL
jgi:hypothetical protein